MDTEAKAAEYTGKISSTEMATIYTQLRQTFCKDTVNGRRYKAEELTRCQSMLL
ncbi:unnamed protein product, partial [Amoebophrya sp. A25]|eukprot:GSA25T00014393001.1